MYKKYVFIPVLFALFLSMSGCTSEPAPPPSVNTGIELTPSPAANAGNESTPPPAIDTISSGRWVTGDNSFFEEQPQKDGVVPLEEYEGMTRAQYEEKADSIPLIWAEGISISPSGQNALFHSNRNCMTAAGMSVFLKNCETGEETLIVDGSDGSYYSVTGWWLDDESAVIQVLRDGTQTYQVCNLTGQMNKINMDCVFPSVIDFSGDAFIFSDGAGTNIASYGRVTKDGSISGLNSFTPDQGILMDDGKISPDQRYVAFKVRENYESPNRSIVVWDTVSNESTTLPPPDIQNASDIAAIDLNWSTETLCVNFAVTIDGAEHYMPFEWTIE